MYTSEFKAESIASYSVEAINDVACSGLSILESRKGFVKSVQIPWNEDPGGDSHMKGAGMLVGNFELNP